MTKLLISKSTEAKAVATIWNMGAESLNPDDYADLERILNRIIITRNIERKTVGIEHRLLCGKEFHNIGCAANNPTPSPCNCDAK